MEVNYVEPTAVQYAANSATMDYGLAGLLGSQAGQPSEPALQRVSSYTLWLIEWPRIRVLRQQIEGIDVMNYVYLVPTPRKRVSKSPDKHRITTEMVGWIEGRDHCEA